MTFKQLCKEFVQAYAVAFVLALPLMLYFAFMKP